MDERGRFGLVVDISLQNQAVVRGIIALHDVAFIVFDDLKCVLIVWMQMENSLFLWAFKGQERPNQDTKLFQAPLFNVWGRGQVCWGSSARVSNDQVGDPKAWEKAFFESAFSHPNFTEKNRLTRRTDPVKFWQRMLKTPMETFPETELVALDLKVGDLLGVDVMSRLQKIPKPKGEF